MVVIIAFVDPSQIPFVSTFLFVFAIVFGLLVYSKVGEFDRKVNALIALAVAAFSVLYEPLVFGLQQLMPIAVIILIILFFLIFLKKMFGDKDKADAFLLAATLGVLLLVLVIMGDRVALLLPGVDAANAIWIAGLAIAVLFFLAAYQQKQ